MKKTIKVVTNWVVENLNCRTTTEIETDIDKVGSKTGNRSGNSQSITEVTPKDNITKTINNSAKTVNKLCIV